MKTNTLIVGGGLTGLSLAGRLQRAGHDFQLLEGRARLGGRIKSLQVDGAAFDLGPSWIWPGQTRVARLLQELGLRTFAQWDDGVQLYEQPGGAVIQNRGFMSMAGSYRIEGGTTTLTNTLAGGLDPDRLHLNTPALRISDRPRGVETAAEFVEASRIVLAVPPRIAAELSFDPILSVDAVASLRSVPTWMAPHAKFVAVYRTPFWRAHGLSGDASSRRGPMIEIHDASPEDGTLGAMFGFIGVPAAARANSADAVAQAALDQLVNLFGSQAGAPLSTKLEDWSQAPFTTTQADLAAPQGHPAYEVLPQLGPLWDGNLIITSSEIGIDNCGLIEGALAASERAAAQILATNP